MNNIFANGKQKHDNQLIKGLNGIHDNQQIKVGKKSQ